MYLTATIPNGVATGSVTVTTPHGTLSARKKLRVTPKITALAPVTGPVGTPVIITGVSLKQTTRVAVGGVDATFHVHSDTEVRATVPPGAVTGNISITTSAELLTIQRVSR
jgi:IPT/TIG domain-containing protein